MNPYLAVIAKKRVAGGGGGAGINGFSNYTAFTIDHTKVPSTQTDFPVLISVTDARFKTVANGGHVQNASGFDIRPCSDSGLTTALTYELERYNASTGEVVMWVKIASLSSSVDTVIYLGYGKASLTTDASSTSTWSNSYLGVYHLGDGTTLGVNSSTGSNNGTNHSATATTGQIDGAASLVAASTQYIDLGTGMNPAAVTYSAWVKATSFPNSYNGVIIRLSGSTYNGAWIRSTGLMEPSFTTAGATHIGYDAPGTHTLSTGTWYYIVLVCDATVGSIGYVNAAVDGSHVPDGALNTSTISTHIGHDPGGSAQNWDGLIDEVHIASVVRSANWVTTEYNNQNSPSTFMTLGSEV